ncbi:MAG: hypothetical protein WAM24_16505, partial [Ignavibacteriaceae bacterium]
YYHNKKGIFVNLFIPSELTWKEKGFKLVQETKYPEDSAAHLIIEEAKEGNVPLYIRYPSWAKSGAAIAVNGKNVQINQKPGSYIVLSENWKVGDKIDITYPMSLHLIATNDNPNMDAVLYGPIVLAGDMGNEGIKPPMPFARDQLDYKDVPVPKDIVTTLNVAGKKINSWLVPVNGKPLDFKTVGAASKEIDMIPYYRIDEQRYVIYWNLK